MEAVKSRTLERALADDLVSHMVSIRKGAGISQYELARLSGITRPNIYNIEKRNQSPKIDVMVKLLAAMGCTLYITDITKELNEQGELVNKFLYY